MMHRVNGSYMFIQKNCWRLNNNFFFSISSLETSSLNIFWLNVRGTHQRLMIKTPGKNITAPLLCLPETTRYSLKPTSSYRKLLFCEHEFILSHTKQLRRADESESAIYKCNKCGRIETKHWERHVRWSRLPAATWIEVKWPKVNLFYKWVRFVWWLTGVGETVLNVIDWFSMMKRGRPIKLKSSPIPIMVIVVVMLVVVVASVMYRSYDYSEYKYPCIAHKITILPYESDDITTLISNCRKKIWKSILQLPPSPSPHVWFSYQFWTVRLSNFFFSHHLEFYLVEIWWL